MKFFILFVITYCLEMAVSELLTTQSGSFDLSLSQKSPKKKAFVRYMMCLDSVPLLIDASVRNKNVSVLHEYYVRVTEIFIHGFILQLEENVEDDWHENLVVDWISYSGAGIIQKRNFIWMPEPSKAGTRTLAEADTVCRNLSAALVDIEDKGMYDAVYSYINATIGTVDKVFAAVWLAMNYNPQNGSMSSSAGLPSYNGSWYPGYPKSDPLTTAMTMRVRTAPTNTYIGLWNLDPTSRPNTRILCAKAL